MTEVGPNGCKARSKRTGQLCAGTAIAGTNNCRMHPGGPIEKLKAKGQVVLELRRWGLDGAEELADPGQVLLRLVTQSAHRAEFYGQLLGQAYDAAERLRELDDAADIGTLDEALPPHEDNPTDRERAFHDLARVFQQGGLSTLIGVKWSAAGKDGHLFQAEEGIRGLVRLEAEERDRCAGFAAKAVAAGLAERQVRLAEQQGQLVAQVIQAVLGQLGLTAEQWELVPTIVPQQLRALTGGAA